METTTAAEFVKQVFDALNRRDHARASHYFAEEVALTGAEFMALEGRDAVIKHFRQRDSALSDSSLKTVNILTGEAKVGVEFDLGPGRGSVPPPAGSLPSRSSGS